MSKDLSHLSMHDLFRMEAETQTQVLTSGLLALERAPTAAIELEKCMRAAHSLKGAARIVNLDLGVALAHAMEDCFVFAQTGEITLDQNQIDLLLRGVDLLMSFTKTLDSAAGPDDALSHDIDSFIQQLKSMLASQKADQALKAPSPSSPAMTPAPVTSPVMAPVAPIPALVTPVAAPAPAQSIAAESDNSDRVLRLTVENLNHLLGLVGETLVESRWLKPFGDSLMRLKRLQHDAVKSLEHVRATLPEGTTDERTDAAIMDAQKKLSDCEEYLSLRLTELETSDRRSTNLAHRLYDEALACRMRPFKDGIQAFPRMVRDLGRSLGKSVRLEVSGETTQIDRDILEKLEAPLGHLLRNALDHGIEEPDARRMVGKSVEGVIRIEAHHSAGALQIIVSDDGGGIDLDKLRGSVVTRGLTNSETAEKLSENELLQFLFLPGFSMKGAVTEISGRGVGLDVVQDMVKQVRGIVRVSSQKGQGTRFVLQLPLTLSVVRALIVEIGSEPYAFPLASIARAVKLPRDKIETLEGRQHFELDGVQIGLITAHQLLEQPVSQTAGDEIPIIVVTDQGHSYGVVVDRFLGGRELVVQPLDRRLGKIRNISSAALTDDGWPVLIIDVEDMLRSMEKLIASSHLSKVQKDGANVGESRRKRLLIVDDSLTVRELQRKLLSHHGYEIEIAVDGMDGWNAVRTGKFDLVITDIDMPRMDGIELVGLIKRDAELNALPVVIVSYKDREEDRRRGLDAGADYYLTKSSFHDETLLDAVVDLIGEAA